MCHSLSADYWFMSSRGCPSYHGHREKWFISLNLRFYRSKCRVFRRWRHECELSDIVPICQKRFLRRPIILAWNRNCWAITDGVTLACNILIAFSLSTCVRFGIVNKQCVTFNFKFLKCMCSSKLDIRLVISVIITCINLNKMNVHVKNLKIKRKPALWFGLTEPNKTVGIMCGRNSSET